MNLSQRLLLTLSLALLALLFVGLGGIWQMSRSEERFEYFNDNTLTSVRDLDTMERAVTAMRVALYRHALADTPELKSEAEGMLADAAKSFETALSKYEREDISDDTDRKMLETDRAAMSRYRAAQGPFGEIARQRRRRNAPDAGARRTRRASAALRKAILDHGDYNARMGAELVASNKAAYTFAVRAFSIAIAMAILITGVLAFSLYRRIHDSPAQIQGSLEHVSTTLDLGHRATVGRLDEVGRTADAFNRTVERVAATLGEVRRSTESVTVAASQIAAGNTDLSRTRAAGRVAGRNRIEHGRADHHGQAQCRQRAPGQLAGRQCRQRGRTRQRLGAADGQHHDRHQRQRRPHRRDHRTDRGHRLPDQHPALNAAVEARARASRARLRRGGRRGAQLGPALVERGQGNQGTDRHLGNDRA